MGLFKEFKDDFSQAVNELVPGDVPEKEVEPKAQTADAKTNRCFFASKSLM